MSPDIRAQVQVDLEQISSLKKIYAGVFKRALQEPPDHETVIVLANILHSLYNGSENAIKRLLIYFDGEVPGGQASHTELLLQAAREQQDRPAVISEELHMQLKPLMGFRHFFRHSYSFQMDWEKLADQVKDFDLTVALLTRDLNAFLDWSSEAGFSDRGS